ncbi:hypothetical protein GTQ40_15755 [Flavobacteriaceae bacterium R38]|nr:hypothetical protein [Flavobacteriaceae bacterium R38]
MLGALGYLAKIILEHRLKIQESKRLSELKKIELSHNSYYKEKIDFIKRLYQSLSKLDSFISMSQYTDETQKDFLDKHFNILYSLAIESKLYLNNKKTSQLKWVCASTSLLQHLSKENAAKIKSWNFSNTEDVSKVFDKEIKIEHALKELLDDLAYEYKSYFEVNNFE